MEKKAWVWTRSGQEEGVHIQTRTSIELPVQTGKLHHGTLRLAWLQENSTFQPHQHTLSQVLADGVANAMFSLRGLDAPADANSARA